jgi:hypothetical protein
MFSRKALRRKEGPQGRLHPITCATPIIMAHPWLLRQAWPQRGGNQDRGWAVIRDKTNGIRRRAHARRCRLITLGTTERDPHTMPAVENINAKPLRWR